MSLAADTEDCASGGGPRSRRTTGVPSASILEEQVPTPFAYIDLGILSANIEAMATASRDTGVALRPHIKTHKIAAIASRQLTAGAGGLTVATVGEAEAMYDAGVRCSFMVACPFWGQARVSRFIDLAQRCEMIACVDTVEFARQLSSAAAEVGARVPLVLIIDAGYGRFGVQPGSAEHIAMAVASLPAVNLIGIRSHAGNTYAHREKPARTRIVQDEIEIMSTTAEHLDWIDDPIVSIGCTPGAEAFFDAHDKGAVTEFRPGNYVFYDRQQHSLGVTDFNRCAIKVVATVVSQPRPGVAILDAGRMTLSSALDPFATGYGHIEQAPEATITQLTQENAAVAHSGEIQLGERVTIIPNHACEITNLAPTVYFGTGTQLEGAWSPEAGRRSN